jgi:hypothetical protein
MTASTAAQTGGCHRGRVRYQVAPDLSRVISCNCSHCQKRGLLLAFTSPDQFSLTAGQNELSDYQFNKKVVHHLYCSTCGIQSFARGTTPDGKEMVAINVRCLDGVDPTTLTLTPVDGRSR